MDKLIDKTRVQERAERSRDDKIVDMSAPFGMLIRPRVASLTIQCPRPHIPGVS